MCKSRKYNAHTQNVYMPTCETHAIWVIDMHVFFVVARRRAIPTICYCTIYIETIFSLSLLERRNIVV